MRAALARAPAPRAERERPRQADDEHGARDQQPAARGLRRVLPLIADDPAEPDPDRRPHDGADGVERGEARPAEPVAHEHRPRDDAHDGEEAAEDHAERPVTRQARHAVVDAAARATREPAVDIHEPRAAARRRPEPDLVGEHGAQGAERDEGGEAEDLRHPCSGHPQTSRAGGRSRIARDPPRPSPLGPPPGLQALIHLDTSLLVDALTGPRRSGAALRRALERGERLALSPPVLYEWLRGPRLEEELTAQEALFPAERAPVFGPREAEVAAALYSQVQRARQREFDLCIAACALTHGAALWTLNPGDFRDVPDLTLFAT
ncbi:MAG: hypothetical protein DMD76_22430 [Candidatus Rokuibacteriota bacterium]|nr:MAG: hypothetical protein DMD76_22430 [Candidatus Rokubacteria bacterium]